MNSLKKDIIFYFLGANFIALGVVLMIKSTLGTGPWDSFFVALARITPLTIGSSAIVALFVITMGVVLVRKQGRYLFIFAPIIVVGALIDVYDLIVLASYEPQALGRLWPFLYGILTVPLGGALLMQTRLPAGVFEEVMLLVMDRFKTEKMGLVRIIMELVPVILALSITLSVFNDWGTLQWGTLVYVLSAGPLIQFYHTHLRRLSHASAH